MDIPAFLEKQLGHFSTHATTCGFSEDGNAFLDMTRPTNVMTQSEIMALTPWWTAPKLDEEMVVAYYGDYLEMWSEEEGKLSRTPDFIRVNNLPTYTDVRSGSGFVCDYCNHSNFDMTRKYYCSKCYRDVCTFCHEETTPEMAEANGSTREKWFNRQSAIAPCRAHGFELEPPESFPNPRYCNACRKNITDPQWLTDGAKYDVHFTCAVDDPRRGQYINRFQQCNYRHFGSVLDWFPVIKPYDEWETKSCDYILICINKDRVSTAEGAQPLFARTYRIGTHEHLGIMQISKESVIHKI